MYGGDVYENGKPEEFDLFNAVYGDVLPRLAETPGNHDWYTPDATGYEGYWLSLQPPALTRIDCRETGPARHHYTQPLGNGWLGVFVDCGHEAVEAPSEMVLSRIQGWITAHGSRRIIVFLHHARLSCSHMHGNNTAFDPLWQRCFDSAGAPHVAAWVAGHNHNMAIYSPRAKGGGADQDPPKSGNGNADGVQIFVNGAGGQGHYPQDDGPMGTIPDVFTDDSNYGFLRIELADANTARFQNFSTGGTGVAAAEAVGPSVTISVADG